MGRAARHSLLVFLSIGVLAIGCSDDTTSQEAGVDAAPDGASTEGISQPDGPARDGDPDGPVPDGPARDGDPDGPAPDGPAPVPALKGVWGLSASAVWAVGEGGTILANLGTGWKTAASGTNADLFDVWGASASDLWAAGDGAILRRVAGSWSKVFEPTDHNQKPAAVWKVHGSSATNIWTGGDRAAFYRYDGTKWTYAPPYESLGLMLTGLHVDPTTTWAATHSDSVWTHDGSTWTQQYIPSGIHFGGLSGTGPGDLWAAAGTELYRHTPGGGSWSKTHTFPSHVLEIHAVSNSDVWAVGFDAIYHYDGAGWATVSATPASGYYDVWGASATDVWIVGEDALILRYDGAAFTVANKGSLPK